MAATNKAAVSNTLKTQVAGKAANPAAAPSVPQKTIRDVILTDMKDAMANILPSIGYTPERFLQTIYGEIHKNPTLMQCTHASLIASVLQAGQLGLVPGILGHCYLIPRNVSKWVPGPNGRKEKITEKQAQFQIGYKGLLELVRRAKEVSYITAMEVNEKDHFVCSYGSGGKLEHIPSDDADPGPVTKYYAYARLKDGSEYYLSMSKAKVELHRDKFASSRDYNTQEVTGPWKEHFDAMALKTVLKGLIKWMPLSLDDQDRIAKDETITNLKVTDNKVEVENIFEYELDEHGDSASQIYEHNGKQADVNGEIIEGSEQAAAGSEA